MNLGVLRKNVKDTDIKRINVHTFKCLIDVTSYRTTLNLSYIFQPFSGQSDKSQHSTTHTEVLCILFLYIRRKNFES